MEPITDRDPVDPPTASHAQLMSDAWLRAFIEESTESMGAFRPVLDADGRFRDAEILYVNRISRERYLGGLPMEALAGRNLFEVSPAARALAFETFAAFVERGERARELVHGERADGEFWTDASLAWFPGGFVYVGRDLTEAQRALQALEASEARYAHLVAGLTIGVYIAQEEGDLPPRFEYVSTQCARILGADAAAMIRDPGVVLRRIRADDLVRLQEETLRSQRERSAFNWEGRITVEGRERIIRVVSTPAGGAGRGTDTASAWYGFVEDITTQRRTAHELHQSEARYRVLAEQADEVVWTMSPEGDITSVSPAVERVRGITPAEARRQTIDQIHPPSSIAIHQAYIGQLLGDLAAGREPRAFLGELEYLHAAGGTVWCEVRVIPQVDADGRLVELIGVSRDITERRQHEEQLRRFNEELERRVEERTRELEAANEELRSFSYSVSHDLRAPVRAVAGFARILQRDLGDQLDADALHKLDNILVAGETMGRLIDDLLSYTRIGQGAIHHDAVLLGPVVDGIRIVLGARLAEVGGTLELVEPAAIPVGDRSLLDRVLLNLVDNAIAYRRPDVPPRVRVGARHVPGAPNEVVVEVADNGVGIAPEAWERIFEVFTRLDPGGDHAKSGIGLATVRKAVRAMGSEVTLDSVVGEGTTFRFTLPAAPAG